MNLGTSVCRRGAWARDDNVGTAVAYSMGAVAVRAETSGHT